MASVLAAADELASAEDADALVRRAVELARERIGLERVGLYVRDLASPGVVLRGTWGTGLCGETTDERALYHECSLDDHEQLRSVQHGGDLWLFHERVPHVAEEPHRTHVIGQGWLVVTPLVSGRDLVGILYNDAAISKAAVDEEQQARTAIFCSVVAGLFRGMRGSVGWRSRAPGGERSALVQCVVRELSQSPVVTGEELARKLGVSPGHLARSFKHEVGVSLVEYRNRLRLERFFDGMDRGDTNLLQAALDAGFGSYAQFHRVYRRLIGSTPRDHALHRRLRRGAPSD